MAYKLIAETAFNHEGDFDYMIALVDAASYAGCNGIKFQLLLDLNSYMVKKHPNYEIAKNWLFTEDQWFRIIDYASKKELELILMPCEHEACKFIEKLELSSFYLDIHTVCFFDQEIWQSIKKMDKSVILSTGGITIEELSGAISYFIGQKVTLMMGFQAFPSSLLDVKLNRIALLKKIYPYHKIGYADHCHFKDDNAIRALEYAYILGARLFEKHITLEEGKNRVDYESAVGIDKLFLIKEKLNYLSEILPDHNINTLMHSNEEITYRNRQKKVVAKSDLYPGEIITDRSVTLKVTPEQKGFYTLNDVKDRILKATVYADEILTEKLFNE